jgi:hypothetical protein
VHLTPITKHPQVNPTSPKNHLPGLQTNKNTTSPAPKQHQKRLPLQKEKQPQPQNARSLFLKQAQTPILHTNKEVPVTDPITLLASLEVILTMNITMTTTITNPAPNTMGAIPGGIKL